MHRLCHRLRNSWEKIQIFLTTVRLAFSLAWHSKSTSKDKILATTTTTNGINFNYGIKSVSDKTKFKSKYSRVLDVCWLCLHQNLRCQDQLFDLSIFVIPWFSRLAWRAFSIIILAKKMLVLNHENSQIIGVLAKMG